MTDSGAKLPRWDVRQAVAEQELRSSHKEGNPAWSWQKSLEKCMLIPLRFALFLASVAGGSVLIATAGRAEPEPTDIAQAKKGFADAQAVSDKDGGRLWG